MSSRGSGTLSHPADRRQSAYWALRVSTILSTVTYSDQVYYTVLRRHREHQSIWRPKGGTVTDRFQEAGNIFSKDHSGLLITWFFISINDKKHWCLQVNSWNQDMIMQKIRLTCPKHTTSIWLETNQTRLDQLIWKRKLTVFSFSESQN